MKYRSLCAILFLCVIHSNGLLHGGLNSNTFQYISPLPGAQLVSSKTNIIIRPGEFLTHYDSMEIASMIAAEGTFSGRHTGDVLISDDQKTIIFSPHRAFEPGERVSVFIEEGLRTGNGLKIDSLSFSFEISSGGATWLKDWKSFCPFPQRWIRSFQESEEVESSETFSNNRFKLPVDFPNRTVIEVNNPDSGYIFLSNLGDSFEQYMMILDDTGFPVFFRKMPQGAHDFKVQPNGFLTYYSYPSGVLFPAPPENAFYALDSTYTVVDSFRTGNGYNTDVHDLQILPNGHALIIAYDPQIIDMSLLVEGGDTAATVVGGIVQELDQSKNVVFQWRSWDHFELTDADTSIDLTSDHIRPVHINSVELDSDGNILISSRNMNEITKIDRQTGNIVWRLGGKKNQFVFSNDMTGFSRQHDCRRLPNGNITLYDNGNGHSPQFSRAVEYELDEENKTARLVWEYRNTPDIFGPFVGSVQRLPNGNTLIGWGATTPTVTEVHPDGSKAFELTFDPDVFTYRAFRFPWNGTALVPTLWADEDTTDVQEAALNFVLFGATDVEKYYIYYGLYPRPTVKVDSVIVIPPAVPPYSSKTITGLATGATHYFRVTAVDENHNESGYSNEISVTIAEVSVSDEAMIPQAYILHQSYPNPFNPITTLRYDPPGKSEVTLTIYNILGRWVRTLVSGPQEPGFKSIIWDGTDDFGRPVSAGVYLYRIRAGDFSRTRKMLLLR